VEVALVWVGEERVALDRVGAPIGGAVSEVVLEGEVDGGGLEFEGLGAVLAEDVIPDGDGLGLGVGQV
jgi:hypothetical protein